MKDLANYKVSYKVLSGGPDKNEYKEPLKYKVNVGG